jgi:DNA-binding transcriptional regulator PaaX
MKNTKQFKQKDNAVFIKSRNELENLEKIVAVQTSRKRVETAVLGTIALVGITGVAVMAPNVLQLLRFVTPHLSELGQKQTLRRTIGRLIKDGYIKKDGERYRITEKGTKRLDSAMQTAHYVQARFDQGKKWDKKWRVVIFDIKESRREIRNELRSLLITTGFVKLQDSVWVFPHRCDEVIALLKFQLTLGRELVYMIVDGIEGDEWLREHFHLPKT